MDCGETSKPMKSRLNLFDQSGDMYVLTVFCVLYTSLPDSSSIYNQSCWGSSLIKLDHSYHVYIHDYLLADSSLMKVGPTYYIWWYNQLNLKFYFKAGSVIIV